MCLLTGSIESSGIGFALRVGVSQVRLQALCKAALQDGLQCVVGLVAVCFCTGNLADYRERRVTGQIGTLCNGAVCVKAILQIRLSNDQMTILLTNVTDLRCGGVAKLLLNGEVPLVRDCNVAALFGWENCTPRSTLYGGFKGRRRLVPLPSM